MNELLLNRLDVSGLTEEVALLVLAAAMGEADLADAIGGAQVHRPPVDHVPPSDSPRLYLDEIHVEGFRGVAEPCCLRLSTGPGLTLVVGRNGSGKSSFAEAAELALTGSTQRWEGRSKDWQKAWRNVHHGERTRIAACLQVDGSGRRTLVAMTWAVDAPLQNAQVSAQREGEQVTSIESLGVGEALTTYRPFLSYADLGSLLDARPSELFDRLNTLLGLEDWGEIRDRLVAAQSDLAGTVKQALAGAGELRAALSASSDQRASTARKAIGAQLRTWQVQPLEALIEPGSVVDPEIGRLSELAQLRPPDSEELSRAAFRLRSAVDAVEAFGSTDADVADSLATLLTVAVDYRQQDHESSTCPVCGTQEVLDDAWLERANQQIDVCRERAGELTRARGEVAAAAEAARHLLIPVPGVLTEPPPGVSTLHVAADWDRIVTGRFEMDERELADRLDELAALELTLDPIVARAKAELERRQDLWKPLAEQIAAWLPQARAAIAQTPTIAALKEAATWVRDEQAKIRAERFDPIADQVKSLWERLRHDSNVSLDDLALGGSGNRRRLDLTISVDDGAAPGMAVLSQGELHALSLALFLPRATQDASPFRFVMIDDPVQAFDVARVDGLAKVFEEVARTRQLVVFTHDDRLPDACRRLGIDARVLQVTRHPRSLVQVREIGSPTIRLIGDARAIASSDPYPAEARRRVVPGLCRQAVESAAQDIGRRRLLRQGVSFQEIEERVADLTRLRTHLAFAFFGTGDRHGDVSSTLSKSGSWANRHVQQLDRGAHDGSDADPHEFINRTEKLLDVLLRSS
ncbi:MAG: AAA family ATPase [Actinomycetales bacterium]